MCLSILEVNVLKIKGLGELKWFSEYGTEGQKLLAGANENHHRLVLTLSWKEDDPHPSNAFYSIMFLEDGAVVNELDMIQNKGAELIKQGKGDDPEAVFLERWFIFCSNMPQLPGLVKECVSALARQLKAKIVCYYGRNMSQVMIEIRNRRIAESDELLKIFVKIFQFIVDLPVKEE